MLDKDGNDESCLDIARRLKRWPIVAFLTHNYPQLEDKVGMGERCTQGEMGIPGLLSTLSGSPLSVRQGGADKDSALAAPSDDLPKRYFALHS